MTADAPLCVAVHARFGRAPILAALANSPGVEVVDGDDVDALIAAIPRAAALVMTNPSHGDGARIASALRSPDSAVRWIQALSAGFDGLLEQDLPEGLTITSQGGAMGPPVAEHGVGMLLGLARGLFDIAIRSRAQSWERTFSPPIMALEGKTAVVVGFGSVGRAIAARLGAFDMHVIAVARNQAGKGLADEYVPLDQLPAALARADAVIVALALADETRELFDPAMFAACKPGALFVNVARGEIVDQAALAEALASGGLRGAAVDVTTPEPLPAADPLWRAPNLVVSPHVAGAGSPLATRRIAALFAENLQRFRDGEPLLHTLR